MPSGKGLRLFLFLWGKQFIGFYLNCVWAIEVFFSRSECAILIVAGQKKTFVCIPGHTNGCCSRQTDHNYADVLWKIRVQRQKASECGSALPAGDAFISHLQTADWRADSLPVSPRCLLVSQHLAAISYLRSAPMISGSTLWSQGCLPRATETQHGNGSLVSPLIRSHLMTDNCSDDANLQFALPSNYAGLAFTTTEKCLLFLLLYKLDQLLFLSFLASFSFFKNCP